MRVRDVHVGDTYLLAVPHELPRDQWPWEPWDPDMWLRLLMLRGDRFALTLTAVDRDERMATGERMTEESSLRVELSEEQISALGLPPGHYWVNGWLHDIDGAYVALPTVDKLRVPTRWLHPTTTPRPPTHPNL